MKCYPCGDYRYGIVLAAFKNLALSNLKLFILAINNRRIISCYPQVYDPGMLYCFFDEFFTGHRIGGVEDDASQKTAKQRDILKSHLGWSVSIDRDTCKGTGKFDIGICILEHPQLVMSSGEKRGKG